MHYLTNKIFANVNNNQTMEGGNFLNDVRNLAIPFGLILAERGLKLMMERNEKVSPKTKRKVKTQKGGSGCDSCGSLSPPVTFTGGSKMHNDSIKALQFEFNRIANELDGLAM